MSQLEEDNIKSLKTILERLIISPATRIFQRGDEEYNENAYQYAKSSHEGMSPSLIIYPESLQEILDIVNFARKNRLGVAVRTGGHQYSG